jgi:hypothetical protein
MVGPAAPRPQRPGGSRSAGGRSPAGGYGCPVPLVAAAVCPHPPALVPGVAPAFDAELAELHAACAAAVTALVAAAPAVVVVGTGPATGWLPPPYRGSFAPFGEPVTVCLGPPGTAGGGVLPLALTVGTWLLSLTPVDPSAVRMLAVTADAAPEACARLGAEVPGGDLGAGAAGVATGSAAAVPDDRPVALLAMGDGTARRGEKAPGYADPRAEAFDATVVRALAGGDPRTLADLDPVLAAELLVAGRAPWQVLAGAALAARPGGTWRADLRYADAPYGVGYAVASWS